MVEENTIVDWRELFGAIINLLSFELLIYAKPLLFMVGSTNIYEGIFIKVISSHISLYLTFNIFKPGAVGF